MDDGRDRGSARFATAIGVVAAGSAVSLATYFVAGGPLGTLNDIGNATTGVLCAAFAWRLRSHLPARVRRPAVAAAAGGATLTIVGSTLVVSGTTGFFLAGLVSSVGFAGVGAWMVALNATRLDSDAWPRRLRWLGVAAGALMAAGIVAVPGIALRLDDMATAPGWTWIAQLGWLGTFVVLPAWALWLGALTARSPARAAGSAAVAPGAEAATGTVR
jgi:hypothetical protein